MNEDIYFWGNGFFDRFDVKDYITGFGSPQWKKTHEAAEKTAVVITTLLRNGATCVAKTIMEEMGFGYLFLLSHPPAHQMRFRI